MGIFDKLRRSGLTVLAPLDGEVVPISQVPDPTFSEELLGKGVAIKPASSRVCAPFDGTVSMMFATGHAVSLVSSSGIELLIHIGLETVSLKGRHFTILANSGDQVRAGQPLILFEREAIAAEGFNLITPLVVCNSGDYAQVEAKTGRTVHTGDPLLELSR